MSALTCQEPANTYMAARALSNKSRFDAAWELHVSNRTLARYELDETEPLPDVVARMAEVYNTPWLLQVYCNNCPVGRARKKAAVGAALRKTSS